MRVAVYCALALLALGAPGITRFAALARCGSPPVEAEPVRAKPSSFAPHAGSQNRVYGQPIQPRILKPRPKKKEPELRSAPLPES
ncbi:MAG: hypothetical protein JO184_17505 [Gammaproteobacteria bacterium]|nr:hypothetical protein [Gammaproteobacteria bacterium]MBV8307426.1 hypothetical protein [Gammaproteobacteria bacterium]MBV8405303.1 hypothetical protein [Gammaproteobacteria bacterium]